MSIQPAFSHATQAIPLARELERRGHRVTVATSATFAATLVRHGLDARPVGPDWMIRPGDDLFERTIGQHKFFGFLQVPDRASIGDLLRLAHETGAQLIVREYTEFAGWVVAQRLGIPLVTQGIMHRLPPPVEAQVAEVAQRLAALARVEPPRDPNDLLGSAYLDVVPPSFRCAWERDNALAHASRPSVFDGSAGEPPPPWLQALGRERPLIYATLGNIFNDAPAVWRAVLTALSGLDLDALVTTGLGSDPAELGALPPNVRVEGYLPQSHVLARCTAVVCHAGFNTVIGALSQGVPVLCLPLGADQPINATCCAAAGAGINAANTPAQDFRGPLVDPEKLDPEDIATAIKRLTGGPTFTHAAGRLASEIQAMPGPSETARILEQLIAADPAALQGWRSAVA
ncbi:MAG: glycosyltransferase family 1 protein [Solirubrobacterales bacterium]|nr:glycosyltransferase family 1 protein [Solirubrobacterales bacterium]